MPAPSTRRDPVVDEDHTAIGDGNRRSVTAVHPYPPVQLLGLGCHGAGHVTRHQAEPSQQGVVEPHGRFGGAGSRFRDRADPEFGSAWSADLARDEHVEVGGHGASDLDADGHPAARQRQHDGIGQRMRAHHLGEPAARFGTVQEHHVGPRGE